MWPTRDPLWGKAHKQTESEGLEKIFHANGNDKKAGVPILISDKADVTTKAIKKNFRAHRRERVRLCSIAEARWSLSNR